MGDITFLGCDQDAYCASVQRHVREFEEISGHTVRVHLIDNDEYFTNKLSPYLGGGQPADVYVSGPVLMWEQLGAGFVEPLDPFLERASDDYDFDDFVSSLINCNRWTGVFGEPLGTGPLLEIPVNCESYNLAYVPATLEAAGASLPSTWEQYFDVARRVVERTSKRGFGQRGVDEWHTIYTGFASQLWSYGGADFDDQGRCAVASPASLRATTDLLAALRDAGPTDLLNQRWYELAIDFAQGDYGMIVDSDHYVAFFEDPTISTINGKVAYALPPIGPTGLRRSNMWTWSTVMNARSADKPTSWEFMQWATSKAFLLRAAFEGNMNPTRISVWEDPEFVAWSSGWGDFTRVARELSENIASVLVTPATNYIEVARRWTAGVREAYAGTKSIEEALSEASVDMQRLVSD
ncbi:MAG: extracellular solute-binding protein [Acidimicrobiales bacterium]